MLIKGRVEKTRLSEQVLTHFDKMLDLSGHDLAGKCMSICIHKQKKGPWTMDHGSFKLPKNP